MNDDELTDLATRLRALEGARPMDTLPELAEELGWKVLRTHPDRARLDSGYGPTSCRVFAEQGLIVDITTWVTKGVPDDAEGRAWAQGVFVRMDAALSAAFGEPSRRNSDGVASLRWAGEANTLILRHVVGSLQLTLMDNTWLDLGDRADALDVRHSLL
ncbi:DUF6301 family protein [Streptomyces roseolus]|uniref:DUF6301 family protein n=1 Tax=Streptomyces roseolus TaxID=67358 RepID=UPI0033E834FF